MRVFITGGAGYIGSVLGDACLAAGDEVTVYDNLVMGHREAVNPGARLVVGDVGDYERVLGSLRESGAEAVIHMAGYVNPGESMADPGRYFRNNTCRPVELLEAMVAAGVGKILFSSSCATYGDALTETIAEDHPQQPTNAYGMSKLLFEQILDWYDIIHDVKHVALRYFNAAGAAPGKGEDHTPESHLIPLVLQTALGQRPCVDIYGTDYPTPDGTCVRDYIHIEDLASAHLLALRALGAGSLHFNLGNSRGYSVREVVETARSVTGRPIEARERPRRPGDPSRLVASSERFINATGWQLRHPELEEVVATAWEWHESHPRGYSAPA